MAATARNHVEGDLDPMCWLVTAVSSADIVPAWSTSFHYFPKSRGSNMLMVASKSGRLTLDAAPIVRSASNHTDHGTDK